MTYRGKIEELKSDLARSLEKNSPRYKRAIIRELDFLFRKYGSPHQSSPEGGGDLLEFIESIEKYFDIPGTAKAAIVNELKQTQQQISELWKDYFEENTELFNILDKNDFEKLQALYKVDFSQIRGNAREVITEEIRRTARAGKGYEVLRSRLQKRGLGDGEARTLANTALAQFDNATMFEFAQQGGIEKFKYDGVLHENTRPFCIEHLGKKYTLEQIRNLNNGQGLPVETSCGGYNCTHWWTPVIETAERKKREVKVDSVELSETQKYFRDQVKKKFGAELPAEFYRSDFEVKIELKMLRGFGGYWNEVAKEIGLGKKRYTTPYKKQMVIAHEGAHARHDTKGLIPRFGPVNQLVRTTFSKHQSAILNEPIQQQGSAARRSIVDRLDQSKVDEFHKKFPQHSRGDIYEMFSSTADFFGALSRNQFGFGHTTRYYQNERWQMYEWFAHCSENYYVGNPYFEHYFPEEYKLTLQFMKEMNDAGI